MAEVVYLVTDLLFSSKIRETARQLGVAVAPVRDPAELPRAAADAKLFILDLRRPDALAVLDRLAGDAATRSVSKCGFIDHERVDVMEAARERGCTALAKGKFSSELPRLLSSL
jgi:hypothetical protein